MLRIKDIVKYLAMVVVATTIVSCEPCYTIDIFLKNQTSQTIVFYSVNKEDQDSSSYYIYRNEQKYTLKRGEKALLFHDSDLGWVDSDDIPNFMKRLYPNGIVIKFENGDSIVYYPSGATTDFHSPYNQKSFFSVDGSENDNEYEVVAEYDVLY